MVITIRSMYNDNSTRQSSTPQDADADTKLYPGKYIRTDLITRERHPQIVEAWETWLDENLDPGHWDSYKVRDQKDLPYIDGHPQWRTDAFMPQFLVARFTRTDHRYVTHSTYTGSGCAICGLPESLHG